MARIICGAPFDGGVSGFFASLASRWPLSYLPALHEINPRGPTPAVLAATFVFAWRRTEVAATRDLLLALGVALVTSLLINDSAAYELAGGIAVIGAAARFVPTSAPVRIRPARAGPPPAQSRGGAGRL